MAIEVTPAARAWLERKGSVLTVRLSPRHGCCGGGADIAVTATCASEGCDREIADAQRHLDSVAARIDGLETRLLDGDPRRAIVEEARREQADLIVIGKRRRNRIQEFLLGSTAEAIARDAHCPVMVVPQGAGLTAANTNV